ncbi:HlyD family type I secretion periplasmic adaptor subunit [Celeribacter litoreus]|uniref:HlyD family type I secretion periplasmic adaptor subunit n=1 Tax=Celeribacter litoreus TaxID=2876714 RepID=UPI001CC967F9|nr:HlyD family type I secretion periplasmic adaptor subunit [Celeribacter litoreus]MCA0042300.1 HlyD family type I secretion periplasmic adaptor subunit [Celeribacter litoreus]
MTTPPRTAREDDIWSARSAVIFGLFCVLILIGGFGGWAAFTRIDGAIVASGQVQVDQNRQSIAHRDGGEVASVFVTEGANVDKGELLLQLSAEDDLNERALLETQLFESLARAARLTAERDNASDILLDEELQSRMAQDGRVARAVAGQIDLFNARKRTAEAEAEQLEKQVRQIEVQISGLKTQKDALSDQRVLVEEELTAQTALLERGLTQQSRVLALRRDVVSLTSEIARTETTEAQAQVKLAEIELQILKLGSDRREAAITELRDMQAYISRLRAQIAALDDKLARLDIHAPVSGVVYGLSVFGPGAVVPPASPILYIVPQDRPLIITARVSPTHVDQVYPGQPVRLRFTSFDQRSTPELEGTLIRVSPDAFTDEANGSQFYRAEIHLPEDQRERLPAGAVLIPGMPVETFLTTGERSPLAYLTKPLTDYFTRAFRE